MKLKDVKRSGCEEAIHSHILDLPQSWDEILTEGKLETNGVMTPIISGPSTKLYIRQKPNSGHQPENTITTVKHGGVKLYTSSLLLLFIHWFLWSASSWSPSYAIFFFFHLVVIYIMIL